MWNILKSGGPLMIVICLLGLLAIFIIAERIYYYLGIKKRDKKLMSTVLTDLSRRDFSSVEAACVLADTPCAQVIKTALENRHLDENHLKELVQTKMDGVVPQLEHLLTALTTIANISTLLGLLGTVTGNIKAFGVLGNGGTMGDPSMLANAIAEALITTVGGLVVSIPSIVASNFFNNEVNHRLNDMETNVSQVLYSLTGKDL